MEKDVTHERRRARGILPFRAVRSQNQRKALPWAEKGVKSSGNERGAKAIIPEPRSVKKQIPAISFPEPLKEEAKPLIWEDWREPLRGEAHGRPG